MRYLKANEQFDIVMYSKNEDKYKQYNSVHIQMNLETEKNITSAKDPAILNYKF